MSPEISHTRVVKSRSRRQKQNAESKIPESQGVIYTIVCSVNSRRVDAVKWFVLELIDDGKGYCFRLLEDDKLGLGHGINSNNGEDEIIAKNWIDQAICCESHVSLFQPGWTVYHGKLYCFRRSEVKSGPPFYPFNQVASIDLLQNQNPMSCDHHPRKWFPLEPSSFMRGETGHVWAIGNKIYVIGPVSLRQLNVPSEKATWFEVYDPESDQWTSLPSPNRNGKPCMLPHSYFSAVAVEELPGGGNGSYVFLGSSSDGDIHKYDVSKNEWISYGFGHRLPRCCKGHITAVGSILYWFSLERFCFAAYDVANKVVFDSGPDLDGLNIDYLINGPRLQIPKLLHLANGRFCFMYTAPSPKVKPFQPLPPFTLHCVVLSLSIAEDNKTLKVSLISHQAYLVDAHDILHGILVKSMLEYKG